MYKRQDLNGVITFHGRFNDQNKSVGYSSDVRLTKALVYTTDFTPTDRIPATLQNVQTTTWDITATVDVPGTAGYTPKFGISAAIFDGDGDKLTVPASDSFNFDGDYTIEGWVQTEQSGGATTTPSTLDTGLLGYYSFCLLYTSDAADE